MSTLLILLGAALLGGASNALAGGGTFLVFPALLLAGIPPVKANATASLALLPGAMTSAWVYRESVRKSAPGFVISMSVASLVGSLIGSILLLSTSNATFSNLIPWLLLVASVVFTVSPWLRRFASEHTGHQSTVGVLVGQTLISVYGGYFGAGMGILMIALYLVLTKLDVSTAVGLRMFWSCVINILAVALFAWKGALDYSVGLPMLVAGIVGGYLGALWVQRLKGDQARIAILIYAWGLTLWFFIRRLSSD